MNQSTRELLARKKIHRVERYLPSYAYFLLVDIMILFLLFLDWVVTEADMGMDCLISSLFW